MKLCASMACFGLLLSLAVGSVALAGAPASKGAKLSLPKGWPSDLPVYTGATLIRSEGSGGKLNISFTSSDSCQNMLQFYKTKLSGLKLEMETGDTQIFTANGGKRNVSMSCVSGTPNHMRVNNIQLK